MTKTETAFRLRARTLLGALAALVAFATLPAGSALAQGGAGAAPSTPAAQRQAPRKAAPPRRKAPASRKAPAADTPATAPQAAPATPAAATPSAAPAPAVAVRQREADYIVAIVNTEPVTNNEVRVRMARAERQLKERNLPAPPPEQMRREILERLIAERAQLQYARETGLKVDDAALTQAELAIARQNELPSVAELHRRVQQEGIVLKDFRDDVRNQVTLARLREREIEPKVRVTDHDVEAFVREQTGANTGTQDINLAMILVAVPERAPSTEVARLQARADEAMRRSRAGEDFAKLAEEFSDANNRGRDGGVLGLRATDRYPELFVNSTRRARVGDVVGPVKSDAGFHILKVLERRTNNDLPDVKIPQTHVQHILLKTGPQQSEQIARERLADFKRRVQSGQATFEALASQHSQDEESARDGGDLGWANPGQFVPEFEQAMNNLNPGQLSDPVTSRFGVHLIRVDGRREQVLSGAEQRQLARNMLREKKTQEAFETWAQEVRGRAYVEYREPPR